LRANELEGADLPGALAGVARSAGSEPGAPVDFAVEGKPEPLPLATEEELLRIAQEAVANARRHGAAAHVRMILRYEPEQVVLVVEDDGRGFDVPAAAGATLGRFGLQGIRERAVRLGGSLTLASSPGLGTRVGVTLPAPWTKEGEAPRRAKGGR
jgi:signal transduction histidine kinase